MNTHGFRTALMTVILVVSLASISVAQESSRGDFQRFCKAIQGRWVGDVTWISDWPGLGKKGDKVTAYWEGRVTEDGNVLTAKFFGGNGSETSMAYYDAGAKQIKWVGVDSGGSVSVGIVYMKDGQWRQDISGSLPDGTKTRHKNIATISEDGNTWTWQGSGTVGDEPSDDLHDVWRRVSK